MNSFEIDHISKPLPVFRTILNNHVEFNKYLKAVILEHRQKNPQSIKSNVKAWHSSWETHIENPKFQPLVDMVLSACTFISAGYFMSKDNKYTVINLWAMMYEEGEYTIRHSHYPSDYAACYYVDVEPGCAPIVFEPATEDGNWAKKSLTIQPENGMLLIWPAIIHHEVPDTAGKRMAISLNINRIPKSNV